MKNWDSLQKSSELKNLLEIADSKLTKSSSSQSKGKGKGFKGECYNCGKTGHRAADCWAKGGGKEGAQKGQKGQKGSYGKGGAFMEAVFGPSYDKGKGPKGKSWGKGKGGSYGKGKGGPYSCESSLVEDWSSWEGEWPQLLLKIVPEADSEGFRVPRKTIGKRVTFPPPGLVGTGNQFSHLEETNEDIPIDIPLLTLQSVDAGNTRPQEAEARGSSNTCGPPTCCSVLPVAPQVLEASASQEPFSGKRVC